MSVSSLPEWKQLLLEKKRREEEERERREKEEEKKFASMPAWKRGIIQRRKAKQDSLGDREKERDMCLLQVDVRSASDGLSDTDSFVMVNLGSETSLSPDAGLWLEGDLRVESQVSLETIVPVHENPFIRTQSAWRKGRDAEGGNEVDIKEREKDKLSPRGQDGESGRGRDIELKIERFRDASEGRDKDRSRDRSQGRERENSNRWKDRELLRGRKDEEEKESDPMSGSFSPHVPCLRTIRADNIIIIEQERKTMDERRSRWMETERERPEEDHQGHRGMKMDLREILAGGGSITEIRASEVLIIKPSAGPEEGGRGGKGLGREDGDMKCSVDGQRESLGRDLRTDMSWLRDKEKERPWGQATVIKDDRKDSLDDNVFVEKEGRVSQLVSKFGQHPKPPSRSKSSDNFLRPGRKKYSGDEDDQQSEADWRNMLLKGVPKRSFSFSDRVICAKENGLNDNGCHERKTRERVQSDRSVAPWVDVTSLEKETTGKFKLDSTRLLDKDGFGKHRDGHLKKKDEKGAQRRNDADISIQQRGEVKKAEPIDMRAVERPCDTEGDEGFTVASVKNTEGISFARRVAIKQDGKTRTERDVKRQTDEKSLERETNAERDSGGQIEVQVCDKKVSEEGFKSTITPGTLQKSHVESAFTECSGLLCAVSDRVRDPHRGPERSGAGPQGPQLINSVLSQHTEELISKIEKIGDTTVYSNEKGERAYKAVYDLPKGSDQDEVTPRSPKRTVPMGIAPGPLEIQIPRSVFYVAEEMAERKRAVGQTDEGQDWEGGKGVERRDSWRIGKPLSRVESLREKIRQRELERLKQTQGGGGSEGAEINNIQTAGARPDERGSELENEWEATALTRKRLLEAEKGQEDAAAQASEAAFDVTQEVSVLKSCSQIPVSVLHSQANRGEEVTGGYVASEVTYDQISDDENDPLKHVEEELRRHRAQHQNRDEERGEQKEEEELSEEEIEENTLPLDPVQSLSPSSPHPSTLAAMSRIYNLETVGSRSGLCLRERTVDIPPVHLVKVRPLMSNAQQGDSKTLSGEDISGVQKIQRQIEQFQLREQEKLSLSPNTLRKDRETGQQSPRGALKHRGKGDAKTTDKDQEASELNSKASPLCVLSPVSQLKQSNQTAAFTPSLLRSQSPDNTLKPSDCAPTPAPSPSSPSPAQSPSISPSPTPSPTLFSIRSASGGQVKRGTTFTITPKKPAGGGGMMGSTAAGSKPPKTSSQQAQTTSTVAQPAKKKYPTVEEIEVIGGYQNLDKSCLVRNRGTPKRGKVCFDEDKLEQVCEYPSESSMLVCTPYPQDLWRQQGEEAQEEEAEVEVSVSTRSAVGGGLRVDESCPR